MEEERDLQEQQAVEHDMFLVVGRYDARVIRELAVDQLGNEFDRAEAEQEVIRKLRQPAELPSQQGLIEAAGPARIVRDPHDYAKLDPGDVLSSGPSSSAAVSTGAGSTTSGTALASSATLASTFTSAAASRSPPPGRAGVGRGGLGHPVILPSAWRRPSN